MFIAAFKTGLKCYFLSDGSIVTTKQNRKLISSKVNE